MSALDYGYAVYIQASSQSLHALDTVYHGVLRFITGFKAHLHILTYKAILGLLPAYLLYYINQSNAETYNLRSQDLFLLLGVGGLIQIRIVSITR